MRICARWVILLGLYQFAMLAAASAAKISFNNLGDHSGYTINITGEIQRGDEVLFKNTVNKIIESNSYVSWVYLNSPGGDVVAAMSIGRQIRFLELGTSAPMLVNGKRVCLSARQCDCASACFLIWAGGVSRGGNIIGIHRPYFDPNYFRNLSMQEARQKYQIIIENTKAYARDMEIPSDIMELMFSASSNDMTYLSPREITRLSTTQPYFGEYWRAKCGIAQDQSQIIWAYQNPRLRRAQEIRAKHDRYVACIGQLRRERFQNRATEYRQLSW